MSAISKRLFQDNVTKEDIVPLRNIADIYQPQTIPTSELSDDYKYVVYGANGIIGRYDKYNHETSQICIACRGNSCGVINYSQPKSWITGNAMVINTDSYNINKRFVYHTLCNINFTPYISGSGQPQIVRTPLENLKVWLPDVKIQAQISDMLDLFELKIATEGNIYDSLISQKQHLLSQMFI